MEPRVPNRYCLTIYSSYDRGENMQKPIWAFSAADVIVQFQLEQQGSTPKDVLRRIEPWREEAHGKWPEWLK